MTSPPTFISFSPSSNVSESTTVSTIETSATTKGFSALKTETSVFTSATPYSTTFNTTTGNTAGTSTNSFASTTNITTLSTTNATTTRPLTSTFIVPTTTTTKFVPVYLTDLVFRSFDTFIVELNDSNSQAFKSRAELVRSQIRPIYRAKYPSFIEVIVLRFRPGSIITETQLVFNSTQSVPTVQEISDTLFTAVITGDINPLNITPYSISVNGSVINMTTSTTASTTITTTATTAMTTTTTTTTTPPTTTRRLTSTTKVPMTTTTKFVPVYLTALVFRSFDIFIVELSDVNSQAFKSRAELVRFQLEPIYRAKYPSFIRVIVLRFSPGSIITDTQLVFNSTQAVPTVQEIANALLTAVETGGVDPLKIIPTTVSVNGSVIATTVAATTTTTKTAAATTASSGLKIESSLLQATWLIIMAKILQLFL
ncbi:mucin-5AC-like [Sinocyclocheilus anshuiensis]|uniref:mucin-5AC-like n=1 Tax=Sinocyclocheilus anshuiensis TaxID=1608454 RepID=UPI0007B7E5EE|nr:PREDICTED: mucin-5AC-like [Sinocyclocheilus anshuiensis]